MKRGDGRPIPHNIAAEESLLASLLISQATRDALLERVAPGDLYKPSHQHIYNEIRLMRRLDKPIDVVTVADGLRSSGLLDEIGGIEYLLTLQNTAPATSNAERYAEIVVTTAQHRRALLIAAKMADAAYGEQPIADIVSDVKAELDMMEIRGGVNVDVIAGVDFVNMAPEPHDWIMPFVIERDDRMLITGGEGARKSLLMLQLAVMTAAGVHWWANVPVPAKRALVVDCEIGSKRTRRRLSLFETEANWASDHWAENLVVRSKAEDIDVSTRAGASWLASIVEAAEPDIIFIGPIYRLTSGVVKAGDVGGEDQAKRAAFALDKLRERFGCALVAETHAAKGEAGRSRDLRPFGSSVWTRWPEFGYGLVRQSADATNYSPDNRDWAPWRGDRDPRQWPSHFTWNQPGQGPGWPMTAEFEHQPPWLSALVKGVYNLNQPPVVVHSKTRSFMDDAEFAEGVIANDEEEF